MALLILGASLGRNTPGGDDPQLGGTTPSDLITDAPTEAETDAPAEAETNTPAEAETEAEPLPE